jgi:alpha-tubulin suppressor-like RCC1 family protein
MKKNIIKLSIVCLLSFLEFDNVNAQCFKTISAGSTHTLAIKTNGSLWAWGNNVSGQLGDGSNVDKIMPILVDSASNWVSISAGASHSIAIKTDGTLWAWGANWNGQIGDGTNTNRSSPVQIGTATNWASVSAGVLYTIAKKTDGSLWAWGKNEFAQLGDGTITNRNIPVQIGAATNWASFKASVSHTIAIKTDGSLWAWGTNFYYGLLGDGTTITRNSPIQIGTASNWASFSSGYYHTIAIKTDGSLWSWGENNYGQLGDGTNSNKNTPTQIGTATNWASLSSNTEYNIAIKTDSTLWAWGKNDISQLGDGTTTNKNTPVQIGTASNWVSLVTGAAHSIAIKSDGSLWSWGSNWVGQLGNGTTTNKNVPTAITCPTVMPIILKTFTVQKVEKTARLIWSSSSEISALEYVIERSINGRDFDKIGTVATKGAANEYKFTDLLTTNYTLPTSIFYRLKLVDKDGKYSYSEVKQLDIRNNNLRFTIYPNPVKKLINIVSDKGIVEVRIVNTIGQEMLKQKANGVNNLQLSIANYNLNKGIYFIEINTKDGGKSMEKFIKE